LDLGNNVEARSLAQRAADLAPNEAIWWETAGTAARLLPDADAAVPLLERACSLAPADAGPHFELALALEACAENARALEAFATARRLAPQWEKLRWAEALHLPALPGDEGEAARALERFDAGLDTVAQGLRLDAPGNVQQALQAALALIPFNLHYLPGEHSARQARFANLVATVARAAMPGATGAIGRRTLREGERLRVGFVSGYLRMHVVARFFARSITGLDGRAFERWVWSTGPSADAWTDEIARGVEHFEASSEAPEALAGRIRAAALDVLVFPDVGLDPLQNVLAALRLAPVQAAFYGHPVTTGLDTVDHFLSGEALEPEGADAHYREKLVRLPGLGARPRAPVPPGDGRWARALRREGRPLLLCAQNLMKIPPQFDATLARIAAATRARLVFFNRGAGVSRRFSQRLTRAFAAHGADAQGQVRIEPLRPYDEFLAGLAEADLVLDTPGFSGGATSLDALGVGAAVLCFEGERARARQTSAMLRRIGVEALIARDADEYASRATALLADAGERQALRKRIAAGAHALFDDPRPVEGFAAFLRGTTSS